MTDKQPAPDKNGQRSEYRLNNAFTVFVETFSSPEAGDTTGLIVTRTVDVSANGIQIALDSPLPLQSILCLCLESSDDEEPFMLTGEVAWLRPQGKQVLTGFRLLESDNTDIIRWKEYIARCLLS